MILQSLPINRFATKVMALHPVHLTIFMHLLRFARLTLSKCIVWHVTFQLTTFVCHKNNIVDPENRYKQIFKIQVELPADISEKDRQGILRSIDRCTVKKVIQTGPEFIIEEVESIDADAQALLIPSLASEASTIIAGKDLPLEETIANMSGILAGLGMKFEIASWRNIVPNVWSLQYS